MHVLLSVTIFLQCCKQQAWLKNMSSRVSAVEHVVLTDIVVPTSRFVLCVNARR